MDTALPRSPRATSYGVSLFHGNPQGQGLNVSTTSPRHIPPCPVDPHSTLRVASFSLGCNGLLVSLAFLHFDPLEE